MFTQSPLARTPGQKESYRSTVTLLPLPPGRGAVLQRKCACGGTPGPTGECAECRKKREEGILQRRAGQSSAAMSRSTSVASSVRETLRSSVTPLDPATRENLEPRFGYDFSQVRIHTDAKAAGSARDVNALAYTVGRDVVFGAGQYSPGTFAGRTLLAHELAHVVQQGATTVDSNGPLEIDAPGSALEHEAERAGMRAGNCPIVQSGERHATGLIQRAPDKTAGATKGSEIKCAGWFADQESLSKRAAELYVRTELAGKHGAVQKIECDMAAPNGAFACTVRFSDGTAIRVIARPDSIVVGKFPLQSMTPPADQPLCWYSSKCPGPAHDLVLTKIKCQPAPKSPQGKPDDDHKKGPNP